MMGVARQWWNTRPGLISLAALAALTAILPAARSAAAPMFVGPSPYLQTSDSPFAGEISAGRVLLETFEDNLLNTPGVTASTGTVLGPSGFTDSVDGDDGTVDGNGTGGHSLFSGNGPLGIRFTFDAAAMGGKLPTGAGIVWTDGGGDITFEAFGPGGQSLGTLVGTGIADGSSTGTTAEDRFFGVVDPGGISAISISNSAGGIEVDHLQYGTPEPGAASLLLLPVAIGMLRRHRGPGRHHC